MRIETGPAATPLPDTHPDFSPIASISACRNGWDIHLTPQPTRDLLASYWHEAGHIAGDELSFASGDTLSLAETKHVSVPLNLTDKIVLCLVLNHTNPSIPMAQSIFKSVEPIANRILRAYTKDNLDPYNIRVSFLTPKSILELIRHQGASGVDIGPDGTVILDTSSQLRNSELPAITTEIGCLQIFENTLHRYRLIPPKAYLVVPAKTAGHQRAQNIVARIHASPANSHLPSRKDLQFHGRMPPDF